MNKCELKTKNGNKCFFNNSCFNKQTGKYTCGTHNNYCKELYKTYKNVCNRVWSKRCLEDTPTKDIDKYIRFADRCLKQRLYFTEDCVSEEDRDYQHEGAVEKMKNIIRYCKIEKKLRNI